MEVSDVRRRLQQAIERARTAHAERRARSDAAANDYDAFLADVAAPVFRMLVSALKAEQLGFSLHTPARSLRLASDRAAGDYIELTLDPERDPPQPKLRISHARGRQTIESERMVGEGRPIGELSQEHVLDAVLAEIVGFLVR